MTNPTRLGLSATLESGKIVAIVRGASGEHLLEVSETLIDAGIRTLEITMNTPGNLEAVQTLRARHGEAVELGTGTVLTVDEVEATAEAGGTFVVSPVVDLQVGDAAAERGLAWFPGAFSPTEILTAWNAGATAVKVFPAGSAGGPGYLRNVRAPLDQVLMIPTGGVSLDSVGDYLRAGAVAVGVGGPLIGDSLRSGDLEALRGRASVLVSAVEEFS
jgi:2-dehydro-3-deoxyphosphogluconate aldolase/(4S)-4-hydroxy-2-oxoglutarate aldolase